MFFGKIQQLAYKLHDLIENDLQSVSTNEASETHWIFYSGIISGDAIEDNVRFSIFVRLKNDRYECNINMSDYIFAASYDETMKIKATIEERLNRRV